MTEPQRGATPADWFHFDFVLGLGGHLLPCVPAAPDVRVVKGSAIEGKVGKIPSQFNRDGEAHGLKDWQKREIMSAEVQQWSADPRLNVCIRTGPISKIYAFDIDIDDNRAHDVEAVIDEFAPNLPIRERENSCKMLLVFQMEETCKKRKIKLDKNPSGPAIELLADGQQFVASGSHSSGVRYQWRGGLPTSIPTLPRETVEKVWKLLIQRYAMNDSKQQLLTALEPTPSPGTSLLYTNGTAEPASTSSSTETLTAIGDQEWSELIEALRFLLDKVADNDTWSSIGYALLSLQHTRPAEQLWYDFSRKAVGYQPGAPESWWTAHKTQATRSDFRHVFSIALARGWRRASDPAVFAPVPEKPATESDSDSEEGGGVLAPLPDKPVVRLEAGQFSNIVTQLEEIIASEVFTQGPLLVRRTEPLKEITVDKNEIKRDVDAVNICEVSREWGRKRFGQLARFERWAKTKSGGHWYEVEPSSEHINTLFGLKSWSHFEPLNAIARAPFIREDGSICDTAGYDRRAGVLYVPNARYPGIPAMPDQDSARAALGRIRRVFHQFPWKEPASESAFVSHILTEATRLAVPTCPMFFYTAPGAGIGKSMLSKMASRIVHGNKPSARAWVSDSDELRKVLFAALLAGDRSLLFDNVPSGFKTRAAELCGFITTDMYNGRKLGESKSYDVINKAVLSATGNNITPVGDMARRAIVVRLVPATADTTQRRFEITDIEGYVQEHRPELLVDALTIVKAYQQSAQSDMPVPYPSFVQWSKLAREPLIWLGMPDPCETKNETDDETQSLGTVFTALATHFGDREFTSHDVARVVGGLLDTGGELITALQQSGCKDPTSPLYVGYWIREERDKVSNGWRLTQTRTASHTARWKFVRVEEELT